MFVRWYDTRHLSQICALPCLAFPKVAAARHVESNGRRSVHRRVTCQKHMSTSRNCLHSFESAVRPAPAHVFEMRPSVHTMLWIGRATLRLPRQLRPRGQGKAVEATPRSPRCHRENSSTNNRWYTSEQPRFDDRPDGEQILNQGPAIRCRLGVRPFHPRDTKTRRTQRRLGLRSANFCSLIAAQPSYSQASRVGCPGKLLCCTQSDQTRPSRPR